MSPFEMESSFFDSLLLLFRFLLFIVLGSLGLAVLTIPIFFAGLLSISKWISSRDGMQSMGLAESNSIGAILRRLFNALIWFVFPVVSIGSTIFVLGSSGAFDVASSIGKENKNAIRKIFRDEFNNFTAKISGQNEVLNRPQDEENIFDEQLDKAKKMVGGIRTVLTYAMYLLGPIPLAVMFASAFAGRRNMQLIVRSLTRNPLRTSLSYIAIFVLANVLACVWSILAFIDAATAEKETNLKAIISNRYELPSTMKPGHIGILKQMLDELPPENRPVNGDDDIMSWGFVIGTLDPTNKTFKNALFFFAMQPRKVLTMLDGLDDLTAEQRRIVQKGIDRMEQTINGVIVGPERLKTLNKRVGDRIKVTCLNYADMEFDCEIVGTFPEGTRYDQNSIMNQTFLERAMLSYQQTKGKSHPDADKTLGLIWVRLPNMKSFDILAERIEQSSQFTPAIKIETASSGIGTFLESYKQIFWAMRWLLSPALLATMTLVISNAINISVRERRTEMAVLKVLGFQPNTILLLVLGEALFIGTISGFIATSLCTVLVNTTFNGLPLPIAFFPKFYLPNAALWWGPAIGGFSAMIGSILPALSARKVKVTEVFSRVA